MNFISLLVFLSTVYSAPALAATRLPKQLNESDRAKVTQTLGIGTSMRLLSNPYPLGGYDGVEISISSHYIPLDDIAKLGDKTGDEGELNYYTLTVGKGLFRNIDAYLQFTPMPQGEKISTFGAQLRWGFYEADFFPLTLSLVLNGGGSSYASLINTSTLGGDLVGAVSMKDIALYFGGGRARAVTTFIGGTDGITDDTQNHKVSVLESHVFFGIHVKLSQFFLALQMDRYVESSYSGRIGMRF